MAHVGDAGAGFVPDRRYGGRLPGEGPLDVGHDAFLDELGVPQHVVPRYLVEPDAPELLPRPVDPQRPAVGGEDLDAKGGLLDHHPETRLRAPSATSARRRSRRTLGLPELPLDGAVEPGQVVLHEVVVGTGLHRRDGGVLADLAAHDDERQVHEALAPEQPERRRGAEGRHGVVGDDEIPTSPVERGLHVRRGVDPLPGGVVSTPSQRPYQEQGVILGVLDEQDPELHLHRNDEASSARFSGRSKPHAPPSVIGYVAHSPKPRPLENRTFAEKLTSLDARVVTQIPPLPGYASARAICPTRPADPNASAPSRSFV